MTRTPSGEEKEIEIGEWIKKKIDSLNQANNLEVDVFDALLDAVEYGRKVEREHLHYQRNEIKK